ncbi:DUF1822 family protein [Lusitaniella coriacea]|uniref:DUF1822 family protein n=1 Tax=Lusitaniella coriacea TaxID=1983105 RepID=UPI003CF3E0DC
MNRLTDIASEFEVLPPEAIALTSAQIDRAMQLAQPIERDTQQWQVYLNSLSAFAFEQWVREWASDLKFDLQSCSLFQSPYSAILGAVSSVAVGDFQLCLLPMGCLRNRQVSLPRAVIELPQFIAHFYVAVEVMEELNMALIRGFIPFDRLQSYLEATPLVAETDWTYSLPLNWLEPNPNDLLLHLRCLQSYALPTPSSLPTLSLSAIQSQLSPLLPQLQSPDLELWEVLSWEEMQPLFSCPDAIAWLLAPSKLPTARPTLTQLAVNVGLWLRDEMDELTEQLAWVLLPAFDLEAPGLRSPVQELHGLLQQLTTEGRSIPRVARSAYLDFTLGEQSLRLYAVTWSFITQNEMPVWTLLLILGAPPNAKQPIGIKLLVEDRERVLVEQTLEDSSQERYLYAQVGGTLEEAFMVTAIANREESITFPPFVFQPETHPRLPKTEA